LCTENFIDTVQYVATDQNPHRPHQSSSRCLFDPLQLKVTLLNLWTAVLALT
jgi:hypothetical protein